MSDQAQRWQGQKSSFPWEQDALDHIKAQMPQAEPYRAWQTFTLTAASGHVREVDLLIATPGGLFLVEIKSHPGTATNNGGTWLFKDGDKLRTIENPLHFTDQKAKELKDLLSKAAKQLNVSHVPRVEAAVFLSAENLVCNFDEFQRQRVYGRDGKTHQTKIPGIWNGFLNLPPVSEKNRVTLTFSKQLPKLLQKIGIVRLHKVGKVGPYELEAKSFDVGPTWEDYLATNPALPNDHPRRVRVYLTEKTANDEDRKSTQRAARREYLALQGISHGGIVRAEQYSDELLVGPAVVFWHGRDWQRLDHFMVTEQAKDLPLETRLEMIRQLAEALNHAHRRHLYHRALAPRSVHVEMDGRYPRLRIADWQVAARPQNTNNTRTTTQYTGPSALAKHIEGAAGPYLAPEFQTPEAAASLLDVFGLGALSYLILTGEPPAPSRALMAQKMSAEHALVPSTVADSISPAMDALVRGATQVQPADRTESIRQFLKQLDTIEDDLTAPEEAEPDKDPLTAGPGDEINGWIVKNILGKGSTSKAVLVANENGGEKVFKVALNGSAAHRLRREAEELGPLNDSHIARLLDPPFEAGPEQARRTVIGVEYVGDHTLADELRQHGPLTLHELERLGEDLFQAITFLDKRGIWHRDIKPDNLALRELPRKGRELVLFDFSLAGTPDSEIGVGTKDYLDPFLGSANRTRYDQAAELYAVAVTLHEGASGEMPSWGDDMIGASFLDPDEEVQLAEDLFDPVARDGLVEFFRTAFHRDATRRFTSLHDMTRAWTDVFHDLETLPPLTTASTVTPDTDDTSAGTDIGAIRADAIAKATPATPLAAAGLSPQALSTALQRLGVSTAGELARVQAGRITRLRGIGSRPRYELIRLSRDWRLRFNLTEAALSRADVQVPGKDFPERSVVTPVGPASPESAETLRHLSVDEVVRRLIPAASPELELVIGLAPGKNGRTVSPWAAQQEIARATGLPEAEVAAHLERLRNRWQKSVPALTPVRDDLVEILQEHGRILGWRQLAIGLLARRGSGLGDPAERVKLAAICVRAAVETEERRDSARMASRRLRGEHQQPFGERVLVALKPSADENSLSPREDDLFAYAELLGEEADRLSARDPLPGVTEIRQVLRDVDTAEHATRLSDTDLVLLAAAASEKTGATPRLELYPRDLPAERAVKISQVGSIAEGAYADELVRRVLARFPDLHEENRPTPENIADLLKGLGYDVTRGMDSKLRIRSSTQLSSSRGFKIVSTSTATQVEQTAYAYQRLDQARQRGGFVTLKAPLRDAAAIGDYIGAMDGVTPVNVTAVFVRFLREIVEKQGRPRWETVLAADSDDASPAARRGFAQLVRAVWERLEEHVRAAGNGGVVLLHDATPLARYTGGAELLARLTVAARDAGESPFGLWLLCPMEDPRGVPLLDRQTVSVIPGDAEQLYVPEGFGGSGKELRAS
jgi:serine/threonine protein kinase